MGTEDGDRLVLGLATTIDGSAPHRVFVVFHMPIGMAMVTINAFAIQVAVLVNVARSFPTTVVDSKCSALGAAATESSSLFSGVSSRWVS